jgi:hypothetical protein
MLQGKYVRACLMTMAHLQVLPVSCLVVHVAMSDLIASFWPWGSDSSFSTKDRKQLKEVADGMKQLLSKSSSW